MKTKQIEANGVKIQLPNIFKVKSKFPDFWAMSKNGQFDIAINFQELTKESFETRLNILKSSTMKNPQLNVNICSNEKTLLPAFKGWLKIIETCLIGTDDWNHTVAFYR